VTVTRINKNLEMADGKIRTLQERYKKINLSEPHEVVEPDAEFRAARIGKHDRAGAGYHARSAGAQ